MASGVKYFLVIAVYLAVAREALVDTIASLGTAARRTFVTGVLNHCRRSSSCAKRRRLRVPVR